MITADARTDKNGRQTTILSFEQEEIYGERRCIWESSKKEFKKGRLGDIMPLQSFNLLAKHLFNEGYVLNELISYRNCSGIRMVKIKDKEFRERKKEIYSRNIK